MKIKLAVFFFAALLITAGWGRAQDNTNALTQQMQEMVRVAKSLKYQQGEIDLGNGLAKLTVTKDFRYLGPDDTEKVLVQLWGNPPSKSKSLGMLIPAGMTPLHSNCWAVTIDYSEDGFVKDGDASKIDYADLLKQMQKSIADHNEERRKQGYPAFTLVGWAATPRYDAAAHKLYWAKDLRVEGAEGDTLNYDIRMLGRKGVLELNAIADVSQFNEIDKQTPEILSMVDFKEGNRYADFDPKVDKVATYGIAALVAGGIAAKVGLFKLLWVGILAAKKFIIIGIVAVGAFIKRLFGRGNSNTNSTNS